MGIIFSRFKRKKSTDEILEEIQNDIQSLEENRELTLQRQKFWIGRLYIYSIILYVLTAGIFYFCFFPTSLADRFFYVIPLLGFPVIVVLLKKFITWYYKREIVHGKDKLADLKAKKKKILDDVMNKETYKVAKDILEKYAPEQLRKNTPGGLNLSSNPAPDSSNQTLNSSVLNDSGLNKTLLSGTPQRVPRPPPQQMQISKGPGPPASSLAITGGSPGMQTPPKHQGPMVLQRQPSPQRRLVRPIIPRERNLLDKIIESLVGDGPNNRYALICRNCASHNGMALKEEFEYLSFRCAYCGFPNPAHKVRPRPSVQSSRAPSEERRSVDGSLERKGDTKEDDDRSVDGDRLDSQQSGGGVEGQQGKEEAATESEEGLTHTPPPEDDTSQETTATAPSDGVRPRKPLLLNDS